MLGIVTSGVERANPPFRYIDLLSRCPDGECSTTTVYEGLGMRVTKTKDAMTDENQCRLEV